MAGVTSPGQSFAPGPAASGCWDTPFSVRGGNLHLQLPQGWLQTSSPLGIAQGALGEGDFFVLVASPR